MYTKWGILAYARNQAAAWGARGARIVSLSPGLIATTMGALEFEKSPGKRALYEKSPLAREGTMLEIADAVEFLASERASFISGTDLLVDGGLSGTMGAQA
jgi:NAD(P)-dependent dehydrogenase (short-subunit alcohol dehydrogenase family)